MPIFDIKLGGYLPYEQKKRMYEAVARVISDIKGCPIEAVSGAILEFPLGQIGQGAKTWEDVVGKDNTTK